MTPGGTPNSADLVSATLSDVVVDGSTMARGFSVLFEDRKANARRSGLDGVSVEWRDDMVHARTTSNVSLPSADDAFTLLALGLSVA